MSYRRHQAIEDVLKNPGEQDITAHVCFTALEEHGRSIGLETGQVRAAGAHADRRRARRISSRGALAAELAARRACGAACN